jgi:hypothetical protein
MIKYLLLKVIKFHQSFEIFTNPPNPPTHLMVDSLKKVKGKYLDH